MRSPLDCIEGAFHSAVFTTYSLNLRFFEHWVLPRLHAVGARRIIVFVDQSQLGAALEQFGARSAGRSYHLVSTRLGPGAFHPKLLFLHGEETTRLCVSSANLTVDGQMRNLECAIVLDSRESEHVHAIHAATAFLRTIAAPAPGHTLDALLGSLPKTPAEPVAPGRIALVHNLDRPLIESFPDERPLTAVAPFADGGSAVRALAARPPVEVVTDGDAFAVPATFFAGNWTITARSFERRRLHAKTYWTGDWLLVGSPNLSAPALLQTAAQGNTEVAIVLEGAPGPFAQLPGEPWQAARELAEIAPRRHTLERQVAAEQARVGSFDAWEDEDRIATRGLDDGPLEYWNGDAQRWLPLGHLEAGSVQRPADQRPQLIRRIDANGRISQAIVHRPALLRSQAARAGKLNPAADALRAPPLTLSGIQALETVLSDLYALQSLPEEPSGEKRRERAGNDETTLSEWRPARDDDEPRIPPLVRNAWRSDPDTLLALIRKALRLDEPVVDDELDQVVEEEPDEVEDPDRSEPTPIEQPELPSVEQRVLKRYRTSLRKLLERGAIYVRQVSEPVLADLAFQAVLRLHEELVTTLVVADGEEQPLVPRRDLLSSKLQLLEAYLRDREGRDASCLATARVHLAECLRDREQWTALDWETLTALAYRRAADVLAANEFAQRAADQAGGDLREMTTILAPYAERADWTGFVVEAERLLDDVDCGEQPFPWVVGSDWSFSPPNSPAWALAGYAALPGFRDDRCYGVLVRTTQPKSSLTAHAIVVDPSTETTYEAVHWRRGQWDVRPYRRCAERHLARAAALGGDSIIDEVDRGSYRELTPADDLVSQLIAIAAPDLAPFAAAT